MHTRTRTHLRCEEEGWHLVLRWPRLLLSIKHCAVVAVGIVVDEVLSGVVDIDAAADPSGPARCVLQRPSQAVVPVIRNAVHERSNARIGGHRHPKGQQIAELVV
jgi:hypothetical protein